MKRIAAAALLGVLALAPVAAGEDTSKADAGDNAAPAVETGKLRGLSPGDAQDFFDRMLFGGYIGIRWFVNAK